MPKSFLFTHRRYIASPIPPDESSVQSERTTYDGQKYPSQTSGRTLHHHPPPPTARIVGTTSLTGSSSSSSIPEEMYNLFQLAEVSLAASSSGGEAVGFHPSHALLDRWRVLKANPTVLMDKPLDLSRETSNSNGAAAPRIILTPSPSPTPSESHLTLNLGLRKMSGTDGTNDLLVMSEESEVEDSSSCYSPDDSISCRSVEVGNKPASSGSRSGSNSDNNSHSGDGHECPDCGKRYSTSSNLARHRQTHRSPADQKARRCPHCDKVYVSVPAFSMHVRTHSQGCKCPYCGKSFSRPWLLQGHIRTHTGEKPFSCQICDKAFADKSNLRAHIQTHSNLKPFTCQRCGKAFALKSYLYKHEESSCMKLVNKAKDE